MTGNSAKGVIPSFPGMGRELECPLGSSSPRVGRVGEGHPGSFRKSFWGKSRTILWSRATFSPLSLAFFLFFQGQEVSEQPASHIRTVTTFYLLANLPQTLSSSLSSLPSSNTICGSPCSQSSLSTTYLQPTLSNRLPVQSKQRNLVKILNQTMPYSAPNSPAEKSFANLLSDKGLVFSIRTKLLQLNNKKAK